MLIHMLFDWLFSLFNFWFIGGLYLDGWAHNHLDLSAEGFFTPWHAAFYSGFFLSALILFLYRKKLPQEYRASLWGAGIFFLGGMGDMIWHTLFGVEADVEALLSPTHLILALGGTMMVGGAMRSIWSEDANKKTFLQRLPALLSFLYFYSFLTFMNQYLSPISHPWSAISQRTQDEFFAQAMGFGGMFVHVALLMGMVLPVLRRWEFPRGGFTVILTLNTLAMAFMKDHFQFVLPAFFAGLLIDVLYQYLKPRMEKRWIFGIFAFTMPFIQYGLYYGTVALTEGIWWSIHLWAGAIVLAGVAGWLLSQVIWESDKSL